MAHPIHYRLRHLSTARATCTARLLDTKKIVPLPFFPPTITHMRTDQP